MPEQRFDIGIIGAGIAGVATAIRLANKGKSVLIFEKNKRPGGKLEEVKGNGYRFDRGPSLFTQPDLIDELFTLCGENPRDYFNYSRHNENCTYFFPSGNTFKLTGDTTEDKKALSGIYSAKDADAYLSYLESSKRTFNSIGKLFIDHEQPKLTDFFKWKFIKHYPKFLSKKLLSNLDAYNDACFDSPELKQLFDRYGTFNGSNPYKMSGIYSMIPHLDLNLGTYFPEKGMRDIIDQLFQLAIRQGAQFLFEQQPSAKRTTDGFTISSNNVDYKVDKLVSAIDHLSFYKHVLKSQSDISKFEKQERSTSGLVFLLGVKNDISTLGLHNIFFSDNYAEEFKDLFERKKLTESPTIYVHVSSVIKSEDAPSGGQNWFVMVNTPAGVEVTDNYKDHVKNILFNMIKDRTGTDVSNSIEFEDHWDTQDIESLTGSYQGALYGAASNKTLDSFKRHGNIHPSIPDLYFCGGTVHPGGGIPLAVRSAKIVANLIE